MSDKAGTLDWAAFVQMRDGFLQEGLGYDAVIVSMDLALLYLRQGRTAELKTLAREMLPIFRSQDVHREAVAALVLFQEAIREEQITAAFWIGPHRSHPVAR